MKSTATSKPILLLELQYLPPVQYFATLVGQPAVMLEAHENYVKGGYRNRCHIASANGVQRLTVPLRKGKNQQQPITEVHIAYYENWRAEHWRAIRTAYGNSPFFDHYADVIGAFFRKKKYEFLWDFNLHLLLTLLDLLRMKVELKFTPEYWAEPPGHIIDLREAIHPKREGGATNFQPASYPQVFADRQGFLPNLSVLDLLFCQGPAAGEVLRRSVVSH